MSTFLVLFWVYFTCCFTILFVLSFVASHSWFCDDQEWGFICTSFLTTPRPMFFSIVEFLYFSKLKMVADDIILSAAHCYEAFDDVDLGRHNIKDPDDDFERYNVETFVTHPNYRL